MNIYSMKKLIVVIAVGLFLLTSCGAQETAHHKILNAVEFEQAIEQSEVILVDVRTPGEFAQGHIDGAINIDFNGRDFEKQIQELDKKKDVYIYCRSGARSGRAGQIMESLGFEKVYDLGGGILGWKGDVVK